MENLDRNSDAGGTLPLAFEKGAGLIPVICQDAVTGEVLMQAYADAEAVKLTLKTGYAHYYSRSRNSLWLKGESSGQKQKIVEVFTDCDADCLLYRVEAPGPACHTGRRSCFYNRLESDGTVTVISKPLVDPEELYGK